MDGERSDRTRYGLYLPPFGPFGDPLVLVDLAVRAKAAAWDGVFLWDHLVHEGMPIADPRTTQAAIAQATAQLRLGPMGALAGAGMTWWMESLIHFDPLELSLEIVDAGPPR